MKSHLASSDNVSKVIELLGEGYLSVMFRLIKDVPANFIHIRFEIEKADAVSCHENNPGYSLLSLINFDELSATIVANTCSESLGDREIRK